MMGGMKLFGIPIEVDDSLPKDAAFLMNREQYQEYKRVKRFLEHFQAQWPVPGGMDGKTSAFTTAYGIFFSAPS